MSNWNVTALGTGALVPTRERNHSACFLRWGQSGLLFDCGEGTQRQMTYAGIAARRLTVICLTHLHGDHCLGLPGVLQRLSLDQVPHPVTVVYPAAGQEYVDHLRQASIYHEQATIEFLPVPPVEHPQEILRTKDFVLSAACLDHRVPTLGYRVVQPPAWRFDPAALAARGITGSRVGELARTGAVTVHGATHRREDVSVLRPGRVFAYVTDTRPCQGAELLAHNADLLVMEATYTAAHADLAAAHGHATAHETATVARNAGVQRLALTHFSARYLNPAAHVAEAALIHPTVIALADLDQVDIPPPRGGPHRAKTGLHAANLE